MNNVLAQSADSKKVWINRFKTLSQWVILSTMIAISWCWKQWTDSDVKRIQEQEWIQDEKVLKEWLNIDNIRTTKLSSNWTVFFIPSKLVKSEETVIKLILESEFLNNNERQQWLYTLHFLNNEELSLLQWIFQREQDDHLEFMSWVKQQIFVKYNWDWLRDLTYEERKNYIGWRYFQLDYDPRASSINDLEWDVIANTSDRKSTRLNSSHWW